MSGIDITKAWTSQRERELQANVTPAQRVNIARKEKGMPETDADQSGTAKKPEFGAGVPRSQPTLPYPSQRTLDADKESRGSREGSSLEGQVADILRDRQSVRPTGPKRRRRREPPARPTVSIPTTRRWPSGKERGTGPGYVRGWQVDESFEQLLIRALLSESQRPWPEGKGPNRKPPKRGPGGKPIPEEKPKTKYGPGGKPIPEEKPKTKYGPGGKPLPPKDPWLGGPKLKPPHWR
jgi:hypothetical protein